MEACKKIAILGLPESDKTVVSLVLSEILKWPYVGVESVESGDKRVYGREKKNAHTLHESYTIGLAQFHDRIRREKTPCFISDGSVLNEFADRKATLKPRRSLKNMLFSRKYAEFVQKIESTIGDYAWATYDRVYLLEADLLTTKKCTAYSKAFKAALLRLIADKNIAYKVLSGNPDVLVRQILQDIGHEPDPDVNLNLLLTQFQNTKTQTA
ncbi:MAG: hypothetical protein LBR65_01670 [Culturomica sp.]|jgi:hypothetical protein|nr:hypothetical protein [Culturomica sp.]